jgi:hypothetical protein
MKQDRENLRKCIVCRLWEGYFHTWSGLSENGKAIVETEDGDIRIIDAENISFRKDSNDKAK